MGTIKLIIIFIFLSIAAYAQDSLLTKEIIKADSLIKNLENALLKDAFERNFLIELNGKKYFYRDEIIKNLQRIEDRKLIKKDK